MMDEYDIEELKAQDRHERRYRGMLMAHPSCRDPDHPGCDLCEDDEDDETAHN
jgi:hypothetical protein